MNRIASPRLSIGLPVFNGERHLADTVESILNQGYSNFELVISDNCSTDATPDICRKFVRADARVKYHRNDTNLGATENHNVVFRLCSSELFKWTSCADICGDGMFELCISALDRNPEAILAFPRTRLFRRDLADAVDYDERLHLVQSSPYARYRAVLENLRLNNVMDGVIRRSALMRAHLPRTFLSSDVVLVAELALLGHFIQVDDTYLYRRMDPTTTATLKTPEQLRLHWMPNSRSGLTFQTWKYVIALAQVVMRRRPGLRDTGRALVSVLRQAVWMRHELFLELLPMLRRSSTE